MAATTIEERRAALESEVFRLRLGQARERGAVGGRTDSEALERMFGVFADAPTFDEAVRLGQEWRYASRPDEEDMAKVRGSNASIRTRWFPLPF